MFVEAEVEQLQQLRGWRDESLSSAALAVTPLEAANKYYLVCCHG